MQMIHHGMLGLRVQKAKTGAKLSWMVTNSFGFNQKISKCVFSRQATLDNETALAHHQFSPPFILLCAAWSEWRKLHYFHESAHVVQSTADEVLEKLLSGYLFVHGWTISRRILTLWHSLFRLRIRP
jgi:hypothetical protein